MRELDFKEWLEDRVKYESVLSASKMQNNKITDEELNAIKRDYISIYETLEDKYKPVPELTSEEKDTSWRRYLADKYGSEPYRDLINIL